MFARWCFAEWSVPARQGRASRLWPLAVFCALAVSVGRAAEPDTQRPPAPSAEDIEFFEREVRPVLVTRCHACHGAKKQESGLRLDGRAAVLRGGDTGAVVVSGDAEASRLVLAIRYLDASLQMPPEGKLPDDEAAALVEWVRRGLPWPDSPAGDVAGPGGTDDEAWRRHWAFQPVGRPALPSVDDAAWPQSPVDYFVLAELERAGLVPSPPADRRTLIRRLTFDLIGLPPAPHEVAAFLADDSPDAVPRLVDRLLASPRYGERWGRHWLDVARYADSKGYKFFGANKSYGYAYRDWVVRSLNDDLPYDRFIVAQLAADQLPLEDDNRALAAMGYLTIGRRFLEDVHDIIDDRIDVVSRGLLGLTVTCARCHDHKFDPIPTADYYSLYGVFAASIERTRTLRVESRQSEAHRTHEREMATREAALEHYIASKHSELQAAFRGAVADYLLAGHRAQALPPMDKFMFVEEPGQLSQLVIERWRAFLDRSQRAHDPVFAPWHAFAALPAAEFSSGAAALAARFAANDDPAAPINSRVAALFSPAEHHGGEAGSAAPASLDELARRYGSLLAQIEREWRDAQARAAAARMPLPDKLPDPASEELRRVLYGPLAPPDVPVTDVEFLVGRAGQAEVNMLRGKVEEWDGQAPIGFERAMVLEEDPSLAAYQPRVFVRGRPNNVGPEVPRQFLEALSGDDRRPFSRGGGRLELARTIASRENPLTARVLVNRAWTQHFGAGLVTTPSDFGLRSDPPSHPELLDWLASEFMDAGWSLKALHRAILLSSTYQQASHDRPDVRLVDAENRLLWRMNRRRLDLEAMRDALLVVAGDLDSTIGGFPVPLTMQPFTRRRTLYGFIDRQELPGLFRTFDFALPDAHSPGRFSTTVPQQALYLMNSPFIIEQAERLSRRPDVSADDLPTSVDQLHRLLYARPADADDLALAAAFLESARPVDAPSAWQYGYGTFDPATARISSFTALPHWTGERWQGGPTLPDPAIGWVYLSAVGGHVGHGLTFCNVRRWTAPCDGVVRIDGRLEHVRAEGDGVRARIVSSRSGVAGQWQAHHGQADTSVGRLDVRAGDTLDFVVDCGEAGDITWDEFAWAPIIQLIEPGTAPAGDDSIDAPASWNSAGEFVGQTPSRWEAYVQALLLANEFVYLD